MSLRSARSSMPGIIDIDDERQKVSLSIRSILEDEVAAAEEL